MEEQLFPMDAVFTLEVIVCTKKRRGNGKDDPIRVITEIFTKDGKLIAEYDPIGIKKQGDEVKKNPDLVFPININP